MFYRQLSTCLSLFSVIKLEGGLTGDSGAVSALSSLLSRRNARRKLLFLSANFFGCVTRHAPSTSLAACSPDYNISERYFTFNVTTPMPHFIEMITIVVGCVWRPQPPRNEAASRASAQRITAAELRCIYTANYPWNPLKHSVSQYSTNINNFSKCLKVALMAFLLRTRFGMLFQVDGPALVRAKQLYMFSWFGSMKRRCQWDTRANPCPLFLLQHQFSDHDTVHPGPSHPLQQPRRQTSVP